MIHNYFFCLNSNDYNQPLSYLTWLGLLHIQNEVQSGLAVFPDGPKPPIVREIPSKDESYPDMEFERYYYGLTGVPKYTQCTSVLNSVCWYSFKQRGDEKSRNLNYLN